MRIIPFLVGTLVVWAAAGDGPADSPAQVKISLDKEEYPFRGAIALTITYTNTSKEAVELLGSGDWSEGAFAGETFEVTSGAGRTTYTIFPVDPKLDKVTIEPGKSWKRTIKDLAPVLSNTGVAINGKVPGLRARLPDPFGRLDDYTLRVWFKSEVKDQPKPVVNGKVESNAVKFKVARR
jgi:hypothetical protein